MKGLGGSGHTLALPTANKIMQPRIYTYKVTFEEIPDWYWGSHKETKYGEPYLGSPKTHAWKWEFYTPHLQICEVFPYTDEGWAQARRVEDSCIRPDLNNPLCLNEHVGGLMSLGICRKAGKAAHEEKDELGRSVNAVKASTAANAKKDDLGRSVLGVKNAERLHEKKDSLGRSAHAVKTIVKVHEEKDNLGRSVHAVKRGKALNEEKNDLGRSVNAMKAHKEKDELGRSIHSVKNGKTASSQKWKDPQHPELGEHPAGPLAIKQKRLGYPHGKENRVRVG